MKKLMCLILCCLTLFTMVGCISKEEKERAEKYSLRYVYIDEILELRDKPYSRNFSLRAKSSSDRLFLSLYYMNFDRYFAQRDKEKRLNIHNSLIGFSLEMYDQETKQLINSYKIIKDKSPIFSMAVPCVFLGVSAKIKMWREYEIILKIPAKKDIEDQYLRPTFVVGIPKNPTL